MRLFFLPLLLLTLSLSVLANEPSTINVSAEGTVKIQPDIAVISLSIHSSEHQADTAMSVVDKQVKKLLKELKSYEIKEGSLDSSQTSIQTEYDYKTKPRELIGYKATRYISFQLTDLKQLSSLMSDISQIDQINISNISFTLEHIQNVEDIALANAIKTAKHKANLIAKKLGVDIKGVHKVNHHVRQTQPIFARALSAEMDMAKSSTYTQKDISVSANIEIEFEIK